MHRSLIFAACFASQLTVLAAAQDATAQPPTVQINRDEGAFEFHFAFPPTGDAALDAHMQSEVQRLEAEARSALAEGVGYARRYNRPETEVEESAWHEYDLRGRTSQLVSLSATRWEFTGGAHGNGWSDSLLWDRERQAAVNFSVLFSDWSAAQSLLRVPVCLAVDRAQFLHEGGNAADYSPQDDGADPDLPEGCPDVERVTLVPAGAPDQPFDRLLIRYTSGVYIEGITDAEIPVTDALIALLRPEWRQSFRARAVDAPAPPA